ncbi:glycosyltransferase family 2 protein [Actinomadura madurae]|uniref:glycosyltransferase family 2 protein n=1 Tax=Actinomadura madurae TaxID=1993 RepID=UPI0020D22731|nr:glycosyltransferase family 2 protein [Actinomadura madurae]MCP9950318.1 glycosyltransferase family 2 protein [Actinomadura madurae]MCP9979563.1 glycosyltransferase family 2 protein [Actinomadura madurae]MCQ0015771.1 glycosyltransferase family 2 protein [Actinomadura madurae]
MELSVVMPCLNEAETVETCVRKTIGFFEDKGIDGEVVIADNGSTDGSQQLARDAGARVVPVIDKGYGNALMGGIRAARGRYVAMGDADDSYDFTTLGPFLDELRDGADLVMGNRFKGGIADGAMPPLHRYLGNPVLSFVGRLFFGSKIGDFHCGLRAFDKDAILRLGLQTGGMEFASEMVVKATLQGYDIREVPTTLSPDGRTRAPHLNTWRDGWRHLRFLMLYSPRWLFLIPGLVFMTLGLVAGIALSTGPVTVGEIAFDVDTLVGASAALVIGFQAVLFALLTKVYAMQEGFLPHDSRVQKIIDWWSLERGLLLGGLLAVARPRRPRRVAAALAGEQLRRARPAALPAHRRPRRDRARDELPGHLRLAVRQHPRHPPPPAPADHRRGRGGRGRRGRRRAQGGPRRGREGREGREGGEDGEGRERRRGREGPRDDVRERRARVGELTRRGPLPSASTPGPGSPYAL